MGERWFVSQLPPNWVFQPPLDDVGLDGVVVICEPGPLNGTEFRVQIKSSARWVVRNNSVVLTGLKRSAIRYWVTGFTPTLVIVYETSSNRGYCAWANQLLARRTEVLEEDEGATSLEIPMRIPIDGAVWNIVSAQVSGISIALGRNLILAERVVPFLRALNVLSGALKGLYFAQAARPKEPDRTEEQRRLISELEITCHRDVVRGIVTLDQEIQSSGASFDGLKQYAAEYVQRCGGFIKGFQELVDAGDKRLSCDFAPEGLAHERPAMMNSIANAMHELTQAAVMAARKTKEEDVG